MHVTNAGVRRPGYEANMSVSNIHKLYSPGGISRIFILSKFEVTPQPIPARIISAKDLIGTNNTQLTPPHVHIKENCCKIVL